MLKVVTSLVAAKAVDVPLEGTGFKVERRSTAIAFDTRTWHD